MTHEEPSPHEGLPPFRGIIPFAGDFQITQDTHGQTITSPHFLTAVGNMYATIMQDLQRSEDRYYTYPWWNFAYAITEAGEVVSGKPKDFFNGGYSELNINVEWHEHSNEDELEQKGQYNTFVQISNELIFRGYFDPGLSWDIGKTCFDSFIVESQENSERKLLLIRPDNPLIKKIGVSFGSYLPLSSPNDQDPNV